MPRKHRSDILIPLLMLVLLAGGLIVMYTIGPVRANFLNAAYGADYAENYFFIRQVISVALSIGLFFAFFKLVKFEKLRKFTNVFMLIALGFNLILAFAQLTGLPIAKSSLGACRWFELGPLSFQPSELLKIAIALYLAALVVDTKKAGRGFSKEFWLKYSISVGLSLLFVVVIQKDLGSGLPIMMEALAILFMSGVEIRKVLLVLLIVGIAGVGMVMTSPHRRERIFTYLGMGSSSSEITDEESDSDSYHVENALIAIGSGGLTGVGVGNSVQATGYLPESINDSVFAIMGEMFGFLGLAAIIIVFLVLLLRMLRVADYSVDREMAYVTVGIFAWLATHVIVNIASMTGLLPLTGITLPLLSYGGTSMMCVAAMLGLVAQFSCYTSFDLQIDSEKRQTGFRRFRR